MSFGLLEDALHLCPLTLRKVDTSHNQTTKQSTRESSSQKSKMTAALPTGSRRRVAGVPATRCYYQSLDDADALSSDHRSRDVFQPSTPSSMLPNPSSTVSARLYEVDGPNVGHFRSLPPVMPFTD